MSHTHGSDIGTHRPSTKQSHESYDQSLHEHDYVGTMNSETAGYISIKDFAYDQSNPLHHGYFEDYHSILNDEDSDNSDKDTDGSGISPDQDKRHSIILPDDYVINQLAVALYDFEPENDNELGLKEGDIVFISYRHGQGWLVAENHERTKTGLVPEEFVTYLSEDDEVVGKYHEDSEDGETARPFYLTQFITKGMSAEEDTEENGIGHLKNQSIKLESSDQEKKIDDDNWEDIDQLNEEVSGKLNISND